MITFLFLLLAQTTAQAHAHLVQDFGHDLHAVDWTPERERRAAAHLAAREIHVFPGNAWDFLSSAIAPRQTLTSLKLREIDWLIELLARDLPALRGEELREELTGVAKRMSSLEYDRSGEASLRRPVFLNSEIFARLIDRASTSHREEDDGAARQYVLKALGVMTRTPLLIAANDGRVAAATAAKRFAWRFIPASFDWRLVALELHEFFWRAATVLIVAPEWRARPSPEWDGVDHAAERVMAFAFLLGSGAETKRCWQLLGTTPDM